MAHPYLERDTLSHGWAAGDERARTKVEAILTKAGMTIDEVMAKTLASLEARRNNALREIDRHRAALGSVVRQSIEDIEDADFRDVETGQATTGPLPVRGDSAPIAPTRNRAPGPRLWQERLARRRMHFDMA